MDTEKHLVRASFGAAATDYDAVAQIQRRIADQLIRSVTAADTILDAGCGTGYVALQLERRFPGTRVLRLDAAWPMCRQAGAPALCADIEALPLADECCDAYCSSLAWQWTRVQHAASEAFRVLRPGGTLHVATLGPDTLYELRDAFASVDAHAHVREFDTADACHQALRSAGFHAISVRTGPQVLYADSVSRIMRELRTLGASTLKERRQGLLGRAAWQRLTENYEHHRQPQGLPSTYDVIHLTATRP